MRHFLKVIDVQLLSSLTLKSDLKIWP